MGTEKENHQTEDAFENALIMKPLFFLAFIQCDIVLLRKELQAIYTADSIRRIATECLLPYIMKKKSDKERSKSAGEKKKKDDGDSTPDMNSSELIDEIEQDAYEQFDDYLEMVTTFGYVTLFASAFPLAGLLSIACNLIEIKNDLFKLAYVVRRPETVRTASIGTWQIVLQGMVWLSIMTNVFIFAFTTEQMMQVFPSLFEVSYNEDEVDLGGSDHYHTAVEGKGRWVVGIAVAIEHALFLLASLVAVAIPAVPPRVSEEVRRREYTCALLTAERNK